MSRQIKGLLYFYVTDSRYSFMIFWSILLMIMILFLGIAYFMLNVEGGLFTFGFPFATYINVAIIGFITVKERIPFALKMGAVRKNIYIATGIFFLGYALFIALLSSTIQSLMVWIIDITNLHTFMFLHPAQLLGSDIWITRVMIDTAVMFLLAVFMYVIGLLFYRGGILAGGILVGILGGALLFGIAQGIIIESLIKLYHTIDLMFFAQILGVGVVLYVLTYFLIRTITTVKVR